MTHLICAIDPGVRGVGAALFDVARKELIRAAYVQGNQDRNSPIVLAQFVALKLVQWIGFTEGLRRSTCSAAIEVPRIYPAGQHKGDQNDLINVALVSGACASLFNDVFQYYPREWKGTMDPDKMTERIKGRLSVAESVAVSRIGALDHNTFDAVGIGLFAVGRLQPERKIFR